MAKDWPRNNLTRQHQHLREETTAETITVQAPTQQIESKFMPKSVALIGTGPAGWGYIQGLASLAKEGKLDAAQLSQLHIFERSELLGAGLPYDENIADPEHLLNTLTLSSAFPKRGKDFFTWMSEDPANQAEVKKHFGLLHQRRLEKNYLK